MCCDGVRLTDRLAVGQSKVLFVEAGALDFDPVECAFDIPEIVSGQHDSSRSDILLDTLQLPGARDWHDERFAREQPGKRDLCRRGALGFSHPTQQINQRLAAGILAYADAYNKGPVTNETAKKLLDESLAIETAEGALKNAFVPKIMAALPATKAARYIQIENKIRAAVRYELAANIPLVP